MCKFKFNFLIVFPLVFALAVQAGAAAIQDTTLTDSLHETAEKLILQQQQQQQIDSLIRVQLQKELELASGDRQRTRELEERLRQTEQADSIHRATQLLTIANLKKSAKGYPVVAFEDTLFFIYTKIGSFNAHERASAIGERIKRLYKDPFFHADSLKTQESENGFDIVYNNETVILSVTHLDALWFDLDNKQLADEYRAKIIEAIAGEKDSNSMNSWLRRIGFALIIIVGVGLLIFFINKLHKRSNKYLASGNKKFSQGLIFHKFKLLSPDQFRAVVLKANNVLRILLIVLAIYLSLPLLFSVFPDTRNWTNTLLAWVLNPAQSALKGIVHFLPNLFTIVVIYLLFRYAIKAVKFFFDEIGQGDLKLKGFHPEWSKPTFNIIKFLMYAFMVVLIFPYLPGSGSAAFQGVSVFVGVLFSFGSSSAISNIIAGLVITYMRPFRIGDRIRIGEVTGDLIEKTMLVTRIRTIKNEEITVPNSMVLTSNTINYSTNTKAEDAGLILNTTVTIGYDIPWKNMHQALIDAALRTEFVLKAPLPFVLQTSLDDFYVSYQLNAYTKEPNKQATIYSQLHQNIQDCCNEAGIEILSPHYRNMRDGNATSIPADYLSKDYKAPAFVVKQVSDDKRS